MLATREDVEAGARDQEHGRVLAQHPEAEHRSGGRPPSERPTRRRADQDVREAPGAGDPEEHERALGLEEEADAQREDRREVEEQRSPEARPRTEEPFPEQEQEPGRSGEQRDEGDPERETAGLAGEFETKPAEQDRQRRMIEEGQARMKRAGEVVGLAEAETRRRGDDDAGRAR